MSINLKEAERIKRLESSGYKKWGLDVKGSIYLLYSKRDNELSIKDNEDDKIAAFTTIQYFLPGNSIEDKINYIYNLYNNTKCIYCKSRYNYYFIGEEED